ncbi:MAG: hypothetical protein ABFD89_25210 [Bryobacteraceae bacterium]
MTDSTRLIARVTVVFAILIATSICARAQSVSGYSDVYYDAQFDWIAGIGVTLPDYSTLYYYDPKVHLALSGTDGFFDSFYCAAATPCNYGDYAWAGRDAPPTPGATYTVTAYHYVDVYYTYGILDPGCIGGCFDWYDAYGYTMDLCSPECKADPNCFCVDVWGTPIHWHWYPPMITVFAYGGEKYLGESTDNTQAEYPVLACNPGSVPRGSDVTCTVSGPASHSASWSFSGGGATVSGPSAVDTWSGQMVVSGTVTATVTGNNSLQAGVTVTARTGWATPATGPQNGTVSRCAFISPPPDTTATLGCSSYLGDVVGQFSATTVPNGPNSGFAYYTSNVNISQSFPWQIHPDVNNTQSDFAQHQYVNCGYISAANLKTNVIWHESSSTPRSHYAQYLASLESNNFGSYFEARVATPQEEKELFNQATRAELYNKGNKIWFDAGIEPTLYDPNYNQSTGQFQGFINYPPYATCQ